MSTSLLHFHLFKFFITHSNSFPPPCPFGTPSGVDLEAANRLGRTVIPALGLPGKVAPLTAAAALKNTIYQMLRELGPLRPGKEGYP